MPTTQTCELCPYIANCTQCRSSEPSLCDKCMKGSYVTQAGTCTLCNSNCTTCVSDSICTGCTPGWTLNSNQNQGRCRPCEFPCATCVGAPNTCLSCVSGFTRDRWKCKNNTGTTFTLTISQVPADVMNVIDTLLCKLLYMLEGKDPSTATADCDKSLITVETLTQGSTILVGSSSSGSSSSLASGLSSGSSSLGVTVTGSSVSSYGSSSSSEESSNVGLIVGLVVGLIALGNSFSI
jgi:hypothetical protein